MHRRDVLDDGQAEPRPPVGSAASVVNAVEPFEDPLVLGGCDADAVVGDSDLDMIVLAGGAGVRPDNHTCPRVGIDHGVLHKVADRDA